MNKLLLSFSLVFGGCLIGYLTRIIQARVRFQRELPEFIKIIESIKNQLEEELEDEQTVK